jgi:hypothetical protein
MPAANQLLAMEEGDRGECERIAFLAPALRCPEDRCLANSMKAGRGLRWRTMGAFHEEYGVSLTIAAEGKAWEQNS